MPTPDLESRARTLAARIWNADPEKSRWAEIILEFARAVEADALDRAAKACAEIALAHRQRAHGFDVGSPGERSALAYSSAATVCASAIRALKVKP